MSAARVWPMVSFLRLLEWRRCLAESDESSSVSSEVSCAIRFIATPVPVCRMPRCEHWPRMLSHSTHHGSSTLS